MKTFKTLGVLSFIALLSFGVASCFNPTGPGKGTGPGDSVRHGPVDTLHDTMARDTFHIRFHHHDFDSLRDTLKPPPPPPPPDTGWLDSTLLDSLLHHHR